MGPLVPVLAAVGAGSAVAGGFVVATAAAGVASAYGQYRAGQEVKSEKNAEAVREADSARQDEIERRRALMAVLANRSAVAGAQGIETSGSIGALTRTDIRNNQQDLAIGRVNTAAKQRALRNQGRNFARASNVGAITSLIDTAKTTYQAAG